MEKHQRDLPCPVRFIVNLNAIEVRGDGLLAAHHPGKSVARTSDLARCKRHRWESSEPAQVPTHSLRRRPIGNREFSE